MLADARTHNLVRKLAWDIHRRFRTGIDVGRLPHISLRQPFEISDLGPLGEYVAERAKCLRPFRVHLTHLELIEAVIDAQAT